MDILQPRPDMLQLKQLDGLCGRLERWEMNSIPHLHVKITVIRYRSLAAAHHDTLLLSRRPSRRAPQLLQDREKIN
jgi:hypothetical protein